MSPYDHKELELAQQYLSSGLQFATNLRFTETDLWLHKQYWILTPGIFSEINTVLWHQLYSVCHAVVTLVKTWPLKPVDLLTCLRFLDLYEHLLSSSLGIIN